MALQTLLASQREAAPPLGINFDEIQELQRPRMVVEGQIDVEGASGLAFRSHSGGIETRAMGDTFDDLVGKGGIRMAYYPTEEAARATVQELSVEMLSKLALRGRTDSYFGAKGLIVLNAKSLSETARHDAAAQFAGLMSQAGWAGYKRDVPAGDVGTNGLADAYAEAYHKLQPEDPYWQASITGKTPKAGGLEFRTAATGWGSYVAQRTLMDAKGHDTAYTTVQGFGNVGAWHAHFASTDPENRMPLKAISDIDGMLSTEDPRGLVITEEMVRLIGDNPTFKGPKIQALKQMVERNQPGLKVEVTADPSAILSHETDYFVPAAMGNVITEDNMHTIGAKLGLIEAANGPTGPAAHKFLTFVRKLIIAPDIIANGVGVDCSIEEISANVTGIEPPTDRLKKSLTQSSEQVVREMLNTAELLRTPEVRTPDMRAATAGLSMAYLLRDAQPDILRQLIAA